MPVLESERRLLKSDRWGEWAAGETDQRRGIPAPPIQKPYLAGARLIDLVPATELSVGTMPLVEAIGRRRSRREYTAEALTLEELSFLLWATQGLDPEATQAYYGWATAKGKRRASDPRQAALRTVPSGGARHPFETYLFIQRVGQLEAGLYRYLPVEHKLLFIKSAADFPRRPATAFESWQLEAAVIFLWTAIPYRTEWRYTVVAAKLIALDAGHVCQNLYLAAEAIDAGACAVAGYDQDQVDAFLGLDGDEEFAIYLAPVGKVSAAQRYHFDH